MDEWRTDGEGHEDGEEPGLHVDVAVAQVPEGKGVEQTGEDV